MSDVSIDPIYKEMILELYRRPLNKKKLERFDVVSTEVNTSCGDEIEVAILFDAHGRVEDIGHDGIGCAISQAAVSLLTEEVKGKSKQEIETFSESDILALLQIPISHTRTSCALLGLVTLKKCISQL